MAGDVSGHALDLKGITHRFGTTTAANNIDLAIQPGELISLLGPSGCGKTTLLKIVAGFLRQTSGDVMVDGQSISHLPASRREIGIVFQNYALFPHMTVGENIAYGLAAAGRSRTEQRQIVAEMLDLVQMSAFRDRMPGQLSGGQQQRIALARCLAIRPRILLLDEPFSALDKNLRLDMQIEIKRLQRHSGVTTVLVTHDQEEAMSMSDRIAVLSRGNLEQFASPSDIYDRPASIFVNSFVGTANFIKARVAGRGQSGTALTLDGGGTIEAALDAPVADGAPILVSIRPEAVKLSSSPTAGSLPARVSALMPIGPSLICEVRLHDGTLIKVVQDRNGAADSIRLDADVFLEIDIPRISGLFTPSSR